MRVRRWTPPYSNAVAIKPMSSSLRSTTPVNSSSNRRGTLAACSRSPRGRDPVGHLGVRDLAVDAGREKEERATRGSQQFLVADRVVSDLVGFSLFLHQFLLCLYWFTCQSC